MMLLLWGSAVLSAVVDNIRYVATMSPVVDQLVSGAGPFTGQTGLWWALLLGADLGGNATAIGASAIVVVTGIAKRNGHPISFWEFTRYGPLSRWSPSPSPRHTCCCATEATVEV